jgi:putative transcriptional regulator
MASPCCADSAANLADIADHTEIPYGLVMTTDRFDPRKDAALPADPADVDDFGVTAEALDRAQRARLIRRTRTQLGLSQSEFARRFRVPVGTLRDWEQARVTAPEFAVAYMRVIEQFPEIVAKAVA